MNIVKVMKRRQIIIPKEIFEKLDLSIGDYLEAKLERDKIVYTPKKLVDKDTWYWSEEGQKAIQESLRDKEEGRVIGPFESVKEVMEVLKKYEDRND